MEDNFKFGDLVTLKGDTFFGVGVVLSATCYYATVCWKNSSTIHNYTLKELEHYNAEVNPVFEKVMDILGIKKDVPVYLYDKCGNGNTVAFSPYRFTGNRFVDCNNEESNIYVIYLISGCMYIGDAPKKDC